MILNLAKYISFVADREGIPVWNINRRYIPEGSSDETYAFVFEGVDRLSSLLDRADRQFFVNVNSVIDEEADQITLY